MVRRDAEAYEEYGRLMVEMARFIKPVLGLVPPDVGLLDPRGWLGVGAIARCFAQLPELQQAVFVQLMTMSALDFLDQWFETDPLKATMAASGIIGTFQGIRSPGTAYVLLHHYMGEIDGAFRAWGLPRGGTGAHLGSDRVGGAGGGRGDPQRGAGRAGPHPRRPARRASSSRPARRSGRATSSRPSMRAGRSSGSSSRARSSRRSWRTSRRIRYRGSSGKVNLALDGLPSFTCLPGPGDHLRGAISISPSTEHMERAYDDAKAGRSARGRTSTSSSRRLSTRRWRRPAST